MIYNNDDLLNFNYTNYNNNNFDKNENFKNMTFTPKSGNLSMIKKCYKNEEEKCEQNINNKNYINSLNNQIYKLENQISHLQQKLTDINNCNMIYNQNKIKLKEYEEIIKNERSKNQEAENTIRELQYQINELQTENKYNNNINNIVNNDNYIKNHLEENYYKKNENNIKRKDKYIKSEHINENENLNKFVNDLRKQIEYSNNNNNNNLKESQNSNSNDIKINKMKISDDGTNNEMPQEYHNQNFSKSSNSNDIILKTGNTYNNKNKDINQNIDNNIYTIAEEALTYSLDDNYSNNNKFFYDKMKGSDININTNYDSFQFFGSNLSKMNNVNLSSDIDYSNDIDIRNK